ncbi:uncharacterized protein H6S33_006866 [Morchella sextelata]|uniref:uncharacterized protein n=1 Tax=Morchella sextelata TaxID=1174677 RepID=UPI001D0443B6|nr:uncharacterized protein H6S33_006866 [Morchella sextelata]KAH0604489.1 hypothetical protein H6S33_006866 [Morchella sextelata]
MSYYTIPIYDLIISTHIPTPVPVPGTRFLPPPPPTPGLTLRTRRATSAPPRLQRNPRYRALSNQPATHRVHFFVPAEASLRRLREACNYLNIAYISSDTHITLFRRLAQRMWRLQPLPHRLLAAAPLDGFWTVPRRIVSPRSDGPYLWGVVPPPRWEMVQYGPVEDASDREDLESSGRGSMAGSEDGRGSSQDEEDDEDNGGSEDSEDSEESDSNEEEEEEEEEEHHGSNGFGGGDEDHDDSFGGGGHSPRSDDNDDDDNDDDLYDYEFKGESESYTDGIPFGPEDALHDGDPIALSTLDILQQRIQNLSQSFQEVERLRSLNIIGGTVETSQDVEAEWSELMGEIDRSRSDEPQVRLTDACGPTWNQSLDGILEDEGEEEEEDRDRRSVTHYCDRWERPVQQRSSQQEAEAPAPESESSSSPSEPVTPPGTNTGQTTDMQNDYLRNLAVPADPSGIDSAPRVHITRIAAAREEYLKRRQTAQLFTKYTWLTPPELDYTGIVRRRVWGPLEPQAAWGNDRQDGVTVPFLRLPSPGIPVVGGGRGVEGEVLR